MKHRSFGKIAWPVSEIGYGSWSIGGMWGPLDDARAKESLYKAVELGVNFIDTAAVYGDGHSEQLIGKVLEEKRKRKEIYVATKVYPKNHHWPAREADPVSEVFPRSWVRELTEQSLQNLRSDYVDLQQLHVWTPRWLEETEWLDELCKLKEEGKVRALGVSVNDHDADSAMTIVKSGLIDSIQIIYNIFEQRPAERLFPLCREKGVAVIVRVPFDEGGLTGTLTPETTFHKKDWRRFYFKPEHLKQICERVERLKKLLNGEAKTISELALRFCLAHPAVSTMIPGMRRPEHVTANCTVSDGKKLSPQMLTALQREAWPRNFYPNWDEEGV